MGIQTQKVKYCQRWGLISLDDVSSKITDGTHFTPTYEQTGVAFISVKDIYDEAVHFDNCRFIDEKSHFELCQRCRPERGDLLVTKSGTIGRMAIVPEKPPFSLFVSVALIKNKRRFIDTKFLKFCLENFFNSISIEQDIKGGLLKNFHLEDIRATEVPVPSLTEQHRIVAKIEELFSSLDKGVENLKTAQQQLKVYRHAVLKWAFEGRLTNKNVVGGELPEGWKWVNSGDLFSFVTSGSRGWAKYYSDTGAVFIRITNLDFDSLRLDLEESKIQYVNPPSNSEGLRTKVAEGDFLFSITGYLGMFAIAPHLEKAFVNQHIALCRPKEGFDKTFVGYWVSARTGGHRYLNKMTKGATKAGLGLDNIKNFPVPLPPLPEQRAIVSEIESRLSVCDKIEESIEHSLKQAEALRQSILKKAFEGKLVPQDPNDEPAGVLLARIKAERERNKTEVLRPRQAGKTRTKKAG
jgi:type I restriction enzyme, S subunit